MFFKQADIFWGLDNDFVKKIMDTGQKMDYDKGHVLFQENHPADFFYVMVKGRVKLYLGETGQVVHLVTHGGEAFGWSSLIGRDVYSASAECMEPTRLIFFNRDSVREILESDPSNGMIFYQRLAGTLGNRLIQSYRTFSKASEAESAVSTGSGQFSKQAVV